MHKANLLLVEDDLNMGFLLVQMLQDDGYRVRLAKDGLSALEQLRKEQYDACILDVSMPKMDGFGVAKHLKRMYPNTPFLFVTARMLKDDKLRGYDLGAEDYIIKPFDEEELLCKLNVILRRQKALKENIEPSSFEIGQYHFDFNRMELTFEGQITRITEKESKVLKQLCLFKNRILRRDDAVELIYGKKDYFHGRSFDVFISKLRKHLSKDASVSIDNVYKVGFILNVKEPSFN